MSEPVLRINDLSLSYGHKLPIPVLSQVSLEVGEGEVVGLVGESGSGKTQTMLSVLGLLGPGARVLSGTIEFAGRDLLRLSARELRALRGNDIAMVFQDPMTSLDPVMRIGRQICEAIWAHHPHPQPSAREQATDLLAAVGIADPDAMLECYPHHLSGGQRQRVGLAIAIANQPRLLIADEPTTALDVTIQAQVLELMSTLRERQGAALVLITHDLSLVAQYADRVVVMYAGEVVESGSIEEIFYRPKHPYTVGLLASRPTLASQPKNRGPLPSIAGQPISAAEVSAGCAFRPRCERTHDRNECASSRPSLHQISPDHSARCHWPYEAIPNEAAPNEVGAAR